MAYTVKLPIFEGPFDLLLHLIKINEMDIYDIPIAEITQKYLEYIEHLQALDLEVAGEFLVIASQLVSMKAKTLLPLAERKDVDDEEENDDFFTQSPREFMRQLVAYRKFKDLARQLARREVEHSRIAYRAAPPPQRPEPVAPVEEETTDLQVLLDAFARVLRFVDREDQQDHRVLAENFSVEDKIIHIEELLNERENVDLQEEFGRCVHKVEMIVMFLAILELARLKKIRVRQDSNFGHIHIEFNDAEEQTKPAVGAEQ